MRKICACHWMRCCLGNFLNPKIDNQNISLISTVPMLVNLYALHYANELLVRGQTCFQKLFQTRQTSRNQFKQVLVMIKHCLGNSQIYSNIPAWSKQFSYITFLYRTYVKVYACNQGEQILFIHSAKLKKFSTQKTHFFFINQEHKSTQNSPGSLFPAIAVESSTS